MPGLNESTNQYLVYLVRGLKLSPVPPMDVAVLQKRGQRLRSISGTILGDGLLERARATSVGLLGATAAVGLAIVALAFNQAWPLVAGTPVPAPPQQEVGEASVAAGPAGDRVDGAIDAAARSARDDRRGESASRAAESPSGQSPPATSTEFVVAPASPVQSEGPPSQGGSGPGASPQNPGKAEARPPSEPQPVERTPSAPAPPPQPSPPQPAPASPPAIASDAPDDESHVPPWSHGRGHAYGRDDDDEDWDDD